MTTSRPARNIGIDLLRVFSIMMVVVGHAGYFPNAELLTIWRMPLFFMLSGFFFTPRRTVKFEFIKRWDSLIIPYLAWSVIISVWIITVEWGQNDVILDHLHTGWVGGAGQSIFWMAAWFITTLAGATLLRRLLEPLGWAVVWTVAVLGLITSYACYRLVVNGVFEVHPLVDTPLRIGLAWPVMFYLLVGELLRKLLMPMVRRHSSHLLAALGLLIVALALGITYATDVRAHYIQVGDFGTVVATPLIAIAVTIGLILIFATGVNDGLQKFPVAQAGVSRLVRTGTAVVFFHGLVIVWMHQNGFGEDSLEHFLWRMIIAVVLSFLVGLIVNMTPASRLLSGAPQEPRLLRRRGRG
ncbi:MAG TPA: acyltransferase [Enteractinococcus sp.]